MEAKVNFFNLKYELAGATTLPPGALYKWKLWKLWKWKYERVVKPEMSGVGGNLRHDRFVSFSYNLLPPIAALYVMVRFYSAFIQVYIDW